MYSEWKTKPPCKGCPEHSMECRKTCEGWQKYQDDLQAEKDMKKKFEESENLHRAYRKEKWAGAEKKKMMRRK